MKSMKSCLLIINGGSSSIKFALYEIEEPLTQLFYHNVIYRRSIDFATAEIISLLMPFIGFHLNRSFSLNYIHQFYYPIRFSSQSRKMFVPKNLLAPLQKSILSLKNRSVLYNK